MKTIIARNVLYQIWGSTFLVCTQKID